MIKVKYLKKHTIISHNTSMSIILTEPLREMGLGIGDEVIVMVDDFNKLIVEGVKENGEEEE